MKRLDHAELQEQLHDALRREASSIPATVDAGHAERLAGSLAAHLGRFDIYDREDWPVRDDGELPLFAGRIEVDLPSAPIAEPEPPAEPFARWLLRQKDRRGWVGELARAARNDPGFPMSGDVVAVRARMETIGADGDAFEALDAAELDWLAL